MMTLPAACTLDPARRMCHNLLKFNDLYLRGQFRDTYWHGPCSLD
jgi:hypothetical protein